LVGDFLIAARTEGALRLGAGTLYRSVQRMLEQGLITEVRQRPARPGSTTSGGAITASPRSAGRSPAPRRAPGPNAQTRARQRVRAREDLMRCYRALLHLYPASFRAEYGAETAAIFRMRLRDAASLPARLRLGVMAVTEVAAGALGVHREILARDLRYALRTLGRARGFAAAPSC
jgi:hypothetical protein